MEAEVNEAEIHHSRSQLDVYEDISNLRASDLKLRIEEMLRIKVNQKINSPKIKISKINIFLSNFVEHRFVRIT